MIETHQITLKSIKFIPELSEKNIKYNIILSYLVKILYCLIVSYKLKYKNI